MTTGSILWILAIGALVYLMMKKGEGCCGGHSGHEGHSGQHGSGPTEHGGQSHHEAHRMQRGDEQDPQRANVQKDPVCGMEVETTASALTSEYLGRTFRFCSERCRKLFDLHPNNYI